MPECIIFDVDGTLLDTNDGHARSWEEVLERHGYSISFDEIRKQMGKGGDQLLPVFLPKDVVERDEEKLGKERSRLFSEKYWPSAKPFPMVPELFAKLKAAGHRLALASSGNKDEVEKYKHRAGIAEYLETQTSSDDAEKSKPHPDIFQAALKGLGNPDPSTVIVVGDTPYDAEAAGKAGLRTVGVLCGGFSAGELMQAGCVAVYADPADLLANYATSPLAK